MGGECSYHLVGCSRLKGSRKSATREKSRAKTAFGLGSCWEVVLTESLAKASLLVTQKGSAKGEGVKMTVWLLESVNE